MDHAALSAASCPLSAQAAAFNPFEPAYMQAPGEYLRWAREQAPVFWSPQLGYWVVSRYEDVKAVFRDNILFSPSIALEKITPATPEVADILEGYGFAMKRTMVNEDEPDHMARRRLLMDAFLPERLLDFEPLVRKLTRQYMDRFVDEGRADLVGQMFHDIPLHIALKFLGVSDAGAEQLRRFGVAHTLNTWGRPSPQEQQALAHDVGRFWQMAQHILDGMLAQPDGQGWMYDSIAQHKLHPEIVTESYLRSMMMAILAAAHETTSKACANAMLTLLQHRSAWQAVCANPALIPNAVEECLRVAGSIVAWRRQATADAVVGGVHIPQGSKLLVVQASANVDASHFENPDEVDVYRESAVEHLSFGYGAHQCMGKNIARLQMRVYIEEFARRLPHLRLAEQTLSYLPNTSVRGPVALWVEWDPSLNPERVGTAVAQANLPIHIGPPAKASMARPVVVRERHAEGVDLTRLVLADPQGRQLPAWSPGAHVDLITGGFKRKYSLCGDPEDRLSYQVVVQRHPQGRGGSVCLSDTLQVGSPLQLSGPKNLFKLDETAAHVVLIAGGIGITPMVAMADRLKNRGVSYELHYAGREPARIALWDRLHADHASSLRLYVQSQGQRLDLPVLLARLDPATRVFACGPERMLHELEQLSAAWPEGVLHMERFHARAPAPGTLQATSFEVELKDSQLRLQVAADQSLLQALQAAGFDVPCDCNEGLCGTCEVAVLAGQVDHRDQVLSPSERATHQRMMACCSRAVGVSLVLAL